MVFLVDIRLHEDIQRYVARSFADVVRLLQQQPDSEDVEYLRVERVPELAQKVPA